MQSTTLEEHAQRSAERALETYGVSLSDELAERSARGAFKVFLADGTVELLRKVVDSAWVEHLPKTRAAADTGATEYEFEVFTDLDVSPKDIEAVLPPGLMELNHKNQVFVWKFDAFGEQVASKYTIKVRFQSGSHKRDRRLDELKTEHNKKQHRVDQPTPTEPFDPELLLP